MSVKEMAEVAALKQRVQELETELAKYKIPGGNGNGNNEQEPVNVRTITNVVLVLDIHFHWTT